MSVDQDRANWASKRCPFGVGDSNGNCVTTDCAAWKELEPSYEMQYEYKESKSTPGWFSDWELDRTISTQEHIYSENDFGKVTHDYYKTHVQGYVWRKGKRVLSREGKAFCIRLAKA